MSQLGSAEIIGGIAVTIGADLTGLRAGIADAKAIAAKAEQGIVIKVPMMLADDGSKMRTQLMFTVRSLQSLIDANPLRIPFVLQSAGGGGGNYLPPPNTVSGAADEPNQGPRIRGAYPGEINIAPGGGSRLMLPGTVAAEAAAVAGGADAGGGSFAGSNAGGGNGDGGGFGGGVGGGIGDDSGSAIGGGIALGRAGRLGRLGRVATIGFAAYEGLHIANSYADLQFTKATSNSARKQYDAENDFYNSIPGSSLLNGFRYGDIGPKGQITTIGDYRAETSRIVADADRQDLRTQQLAAKGEYRNKVIGEAREERDTFGMTDTEKAVHEAQENLDNFNVGAGNSDADKRTRAALQQRIDYAQKRDQAYQGGVNQSAALGLAGGAQIIAGIRTEMAGNTEIGTQQQVAGARQQLQAQQANRLIGVENPDEKKRLAAQNAQELAEFDVRATKDAAERKIKIANDADSAIGSKEETRLRLQRRNYDADLSAFDHAAKEKLATITDVTERQNEATRLAGQRQVMVFEQQQHSAQTIAQYESAAGVATLQANREGFKAQLKAFDDETKQILNNTDANDQAKVAAARAEQRQAVVKTQSQEQADINGSLDTRTAQANARAGNEDQTANVIGLVGQMRQELRDSQKADIPKVIATQTAELGALKNQVLRPNQFATEYDPSREIRGGPNGQSGKDVTDLLQVIADYLKTLAANPGGLGN